MSNILQATRKKLRFNTGKGVISVEGLWDISYSRLANLNRNLGNALKETGDGELDYLDDAPTEVDQTLKLQFEVAKEVFLIRKAEKDAAKLEKERKEERQQLMDLLSRKQAEKMESLSEEEILAKLEKLQ